MKSKSWSKSPDFKFTFKVFRWTQILKERLYIIINTYILDMYLYMSERAAGKIIM